MATSSTLTHHGLSTQQVLAARARYGRNEIKGHQHQWLDTLRDLLHEPMLLLLIAAATLYFIAGNTGDGLFMLAAIGAVSGISLYQESRSRSALNALRALTQPVCQVIRNNQVISVAREDIVPGDYVIIEEGSTAPADGMAVEAHDLSLNESILTGESLPVTKTTSADHCHIFQGTMVLSGSGVMVVTATGNQTELGKIGKSISTIQEEDTPLQRQIGSFVKKMALVGIIIFVIVWGLNFYQSHNWLTSLLRALTLAMSILPEEIPVAFTTFMALGAWRLMKLGILVKNTRTVETLGSATVICTDKTGTITENRMTLTQVYRADTNQMLTPDEPDARDVIRIAMWASEPAPFDPMEVSLHKAYAQSHATDERSGYTLIHEYPLGGRPPMMTHIFEDTHTGHRIVAAKGAPEAIFAVSTMPEPIRTQTLEALNRMTAAGYRVLGVADVTQPPETFPATQQAFPFTFRGLVAFYDPPKKNISQVFQSFYDAGIQVKIITGDNAATTRTIAQQVNLQGADKSLDGDALHQLSDIELQEKVLETNVFTRMFPEAKLRVLNALKARQQVVAMTGDGVNDGPALKAAHIGIAMGKKGADIARDVSALVLTDDDLARMSDAIAMGRKIYSNLKKAIRYIISIHIPIILTVFIPLLLGWIYPTIFSPVHVIFLELIMGPTCSILYENEPAEPGIMQQRPRPFTTSFFQWRELSVSIVQGLVITTAILCIYQYAIGQGYTEALTRTMVFTSLITANVFLTLVNRSFEYSLITTFRYPNRLVPIMLGITITLTVMLLFIAPLTHFFAFENPQLSDLLISMGAGAASVVWYEGVKYSKRLRRQR